MYDLEAKKFFDSIPKEHIDVAKKIYMLYGKTRCMPDIEIQENLFRKNEFLFWKLWWGWGTLNVRFKVTEKYSICINKGKMEGNQYPTIQFTDEFIEWLGEQNNLT